MARIHLSWLLLATAAALRPQVTRRSLCGAAPALVLAPQLSRAADGPSEALLPEAIYAGNDWIADRKLTIIEGDEKAAETAWRALGGAGAFEVLHKEKYTAGFKPTNEKMTYNSEKFPTWASTATGSVAVDRSVEVASRGGKSTQLKSAGVKIEDIGRGQIGTKELFVADGVAFSVARAYEPAPLAKMFGIKEVVTTFALAPDGSVGTAPTSTTKSRLHYEKPEVAKNRQEGIKYF